MNQFGFPILSLIVFLPLAGALALLVIGKERRVALRACSLIVALADLGLTIALLATYRLGQAGMQFVEQMDWIPSLGINYHLGVDGISLFMLPLTALLVVVAIIASWKGVGSDEAARQGVQGYFFWLLLLETGVLGVFSALDLVLFYIFWEAMLVPAYFLIGRWGGARRRYATTKFFIYTMAGSALMLVGILALGYFSYYLRGTLTFDWPALREMTLNWAAPLWLFIVFALAFAVKTPVFPFHTWLPDAYSEAPAPVTILLAGVLSKMGIYGFLRFCLPLFPQGSRAMAPLMAILALVGILYASFAALGQKDLKKVIAYSSVAHLSLVVLAVFVASAQTLAGAVIQMVSHGIYVSALFLIAGALEARRGSRQIDDFGGVWKAAPLLGVCFLIAIFGAVGLPGLNGFVGEFTMLAGVFQFNVWYAAIAALGMVLGAWYMLWTFQRVMQGQVTEARERQVKDLAGAELAALVPLLLLIFVIGIAPNLILTPTSNSVAALAQQTIKVWLALVP
jgi:NADH-quinone oxidoreductase subunit M